jgi:hypothetical protein
LFFRRRFRLQFHKFSLVRNGVEITTIDGIFALSGASNKANAVKITGIK